MLDLSRANRAKSRYEEQLRSIGVPEWTKKYLDYKRLSEILLRVERAVEAAARGQAASPGQDDADDPSPSPFRFHALAAEEGLSVNGTHDQSVDLEDEDTTALLGGAKYSNTVGIIIPESLHDMWRRKSFVRRRSLVTFRKVPEDHRVKEILDSREIPEEREFLEELKSEMDKVSAFYVQKEAEALRSWEEIKAQLKSLEKEAEEIQTIEEAVPDDPEETTSGASESTHQLGSAARAGELLHRVLQFPTSFSSLVPAARTRSEPLSTSYGSMESTSLEPRKLQELKQKHMTVMKLLEDAIVEFYRSCRMLKSYQQLNKLGIGELLKKFNEVSGWNPAQFYNLQEHHLFQSHQLDHLLSKVQQIYNNREKLRMTTHHNQEVVGYWTGFFCGISLILVVATVKHVVHNPSTGIGQMLLLIYGGFSLPMAMLVCFALNFVVFATYRINYAFIFETNQLDHITVLEFVEVIAAFVATWSVFAYLGLAENLFKSWVPTTHYPAILLSVNVLLIVNPFNFFYRSSRFWFLRTLGRIIASGWYFVEFRDFLLTDVMGSLTYTFTALAVFGCGYYHNWDDDAPIKCDLSKAVSVPEQETEELTKEFALNARTWTLVPLMTCVPNFLRLIQCIRRFFDTHTIGPHLGNAFKYFLALITIALSFASKFASGDVVRSCWIAIAVSSTIFTMWWDFRMDVGLLTENDKHRWLRSELIYPPWIYYAWMPLNFILRCAWIVVISPSYWQHLGVDGNVVAYVLALLEVVRRGLWLFLRIENEHANNVGHFRATKEIPLPPLSRDERGQRGQNPDFGALRQHVD